MSERMTRERADLIMRQFYKYQRIYEEQGVDRRRFLQMIAAGSAASIVLPVIVACGGASSTEVSQATQAANQSSSGGSSSTATASSATKSSASTTAAGASPAATSSGGTPKKGGTFIIGTLGEAQSINPLLTNETEGQFRTKMLFEAFVELDLTTLQPKPNIAKEWKASPDGLVYTFTLNPDVKFSDGTPLTASDVEFTLYGLLAKNTNSPYVPRFTPIKGAADYNAGKTDKISGVKVVDDHTIEITLDQPYAPFLANLRYLMPLPKKLLDGKDLTKDPFFQNPVGAGPFKFKSWTTGQDFVAERNPNYWEQGKPYLDSFTHRVIADSQTLVVALQSGQIESSEYALPTSADDLKKQKNLTVVQVPAGKDINGWSFNSKNNPALADARVRRAIAMALDTKRFVSDFLLGLGATVTGPIPPSNWAYDKSLQPIPYDVNGAKQLLQQAGVGNFHVKCMANAGNHFREDWTTFTQQSLADLGITVDPQIIEWTQVVKAGTDGSFEMICPTWTGVSVDPDELYLGLHTGSPQNVYGYSNPDLDKLLDQGRTSMDLDQRKQIYSKVVQILLQDVPIFWAWDRPFIDVVTTAMHGYTPTLLSFYNELEDWYKS